MGYSPIIILEQQGSVHGLRSMRKMAATTCSVVSLPDRETFKKHDKLWLANVKIPISLCRPIDLFEILNLNLGNITFTKQAHRFLSFIVWIYLIILLFLLLCIWIWSYCLMCAFVTLLSQYELWRDTTVRALVLVFGTLNSAISNFQTWFVRIMMEVLKYCWM